MPFLVGEHHDTGDDHDATDDILNRYLFAEEQVSIQQTNADRGALAQIRDMLPDLSGITLPSIGGGTTTQTTSSTRSVTYNGGDINITIQGSVDETTMPTLKTSIEDAVRKGIEAFLDEENAASQTGGI